MDILEKNWKHHATVAGLATALGLVTEKLFRQRSTTNGTFNGAVMTFVVTGVASMGADYVMTMKKPDHS